MAGLEVKGLMSSYFHKLQAPLFPVIALNTKDSITLFCCFGCMYQEKNLKAEEEQRRQQRERLELEKVRLAEEKQRSVFFQTFWFFGMHV